MKFRLFTIFAMLCLTKVTGQQSMQHLEERLSALDKHTEEYIQCLALLAKEYAETNPEKALETASEALLSSDQDSIKGQIFIAFSTAHSYMANYDSSTWYAFEALKVAEEYKDTITMIDAYNNIGIDFMFQEENERAIEYYQKVEYLARVFEDSLRLGHALNNLGIMHSYEEEYEQELDYYDQAAFIFRAIGEDEGLANTFLNAAGTYVFLNKFERADDYLEEALRLFRLLQLSSGIQNTIQTRAENELARNQFKKAEGLALEALEIAKANDLMQDVIYTYELLEQINIATSDYKKAHYYLRESSQKQQEVFNLERTKQIEELETQYETAKKEAEIEQLSLENKLQTANLARSRNAQYAIGVAAVMSLLLLAVYFILRNKKLRAEKEVQNLQIDALEKRLIDLNVSPRELSLKATELNNKIHSPLSEREFEVLQLSLEGKSNAEIATSLFVSQSTIKFHLRNTYGKLGVNNRKEALDYVVKSS